jgi:S-adenosylmethionine hydrolase
MTPSARRRPIITLTTDFGTRDHYVAAVKGALLSMASDLRIVDVTHEIPAHDVAAGSWILRNAAAAFPPGTVHLAVVDPGVGTQRRPLAVVSAGRIFVGPDNGLFSFALDEDPAARVVCLTRVPAPPAGISAVFHARDLFAPAAARLATGADALSLGDPVSDPVRLPAAVAPVAPNGRLRMRVAHVDRFGNVVLDLPRAAGAAWMDGVSTARLIVPGAPVPLRCVSTYGEAPAGAPVLLWNSSGFLEIGVYLGRASDILGLRVGDFVEPQSR